MRGTKVDADDVAPEFPRYDETVLRELTLGVYQLRIARSYTQEHIDVDGRFEISVSDDIRGILSTKIQSRHVSAKQYKCWISYVEGVISGWNCRCKTGSRVVGICSHITSVIWFLFYASHNIQTAKGVRNWCESIDDATDLPEVIVASDSDGGECSWTVTFYVLLFG